MKIHIEVISDDGAIYCGEATLQKRSSRAKRKHPVAVSSPKPKHHKCPAVLTLLWQRGSFKRALSIAEIKKALDSTGYSFTDENILMALSRAKFLTRHGKRGSFTWKQKYPFN